MKNIFKVRPGNDMKFGVTRVPDGVQFSLYLPDTDSCELILYKKGNKKPASVIKLDDKYKIGSMFFVVLEKSDKNTDKRDIEDILSEDYEYTYITKNGEEIDKYAAVISGRENWGKVCSASDVRGRISLKKFDWKNQESPRIPFKDMILYELHVRGFTKHSSSKVKNKGTFAGITEKIPYLKEVGINAVMLLPCYEFNEVLCEKSYGEPSDFYEINKIGPVVDALDKLPESKKKAILDRRKEEAIEKMAVEKPQVKLNYWGYGTKDTYYFAPKASYAADKSDVPTEMKTMVRELHAAGIEVLMDIYFSPGTNINMMTECLRHWVLNYHIDGFRINDDVMPSIILASDPILSGVKLLTSSWNSEDLKRAGVVKKQNALAEYNEGFMNDARRFLKSDEGMTGAFLSRTLRNPEEFSVINFISHVNGFTLMDLVSYDIKHNESNGENNTDGTDYNYSWNCGFEGPSRRKAVMNLRMRQIRNAFTMLFCAQGTPMILAGDEFGNTQMGNNNPYCHDDNVTWLNWRKTKTGDEILEFVKNMIKFRKTYGALHQEKQLLYMDTKNYGMPDVSVHSTQAWKPDYSNYNRMLGLLLNGQYAGENEKSIYIIYNMYWEAKSFDLPYLPEDKEWHPLFETFNNEFHEIPKAKPKPKKRGRKKTSLIKERKTIVPARTVVVFIGE
ncbi:MAG: alpha-amylase [Lachnospiraceae bacterium]|nr:alpha-amylase [Lachnospiraceae bacterium]